MAQTAELVESEQAKSTGGGIPVIPLVMAVILAVIIAVAGVGGVVYWLAKSGRLPGMQGATTAEPVAKADPPKTKLVPLDPLLVNLADDGGRSYLRVAITLRLADLPPAKGEKPKEEKPEKGKSANENEAAMRDAALGVLGHETGASLLGPQGKDHLKEELRAAMTEHVPEVKVVDILFTEFLVQR